MARKLLCFIWQHDCGFLLHPKAKITKFGDKQASRIGVCTKYVFVRCTWMTNLEAPQLECLGARRSSQNFYLSDQLWGLGALAKMLGSPKGYLKFSLQHNLDIQRLDGKLADVIVWCHGIERQTTFCTSNFSSRILSFHTQGPVVGRLISANPGLFHPGFFSLVQKHFLR